MVGEIVIRQNMMEERILNMVVSLMSLVGSFCQEGRRRQDMIRFWHLHYKSLVLS